VLPLAAVALFALPASAAADPLGDSATFAQRATTPPTVSPTVPVGLPAVGSGGAGAARVPAHAKTGGRTPRILDASAIANGIARAAAAGGVAPAGIPHRASLPPSAGAVETIRPARHVVSRSPTAAWGRGAIKRAANPLASVLRALTQNLIPAVLERLVTRVASIPPSPQARAFEPQRAAGPRAVARGFAAPAEVGGGAPVAAHLAASDLRAGGNEDAPKPHVAAVKRTSKAGAVLPHQWPDMILRSGAALAGLASCASVAVLLLFGFAAPRFFQTRRVWLPAPRAPGFAATLELPG